MLEYLINNIFVEFGGQIFQQSAFLWERIVLNYVLTCFILLWDRVMQGPMKAGKKRLAQQFVFTYKYMDNALSLNSSEFYLEYIYPRELELKETS